MAPPKPVEKKMTRDFTFIKSVVDKKSASVLDRMARLEGRSLQMQTGMILRKVAALFEKNPERLGELGLPVGPSIESRVA